MRQVIAFVGKMGAGKTEAAEYAKLKLKSFACTPEIVKFAGPLYKCMYAVAQELNIPFDKPKFRGLMQYFGTEFIRNNYGENFWVDLWEREVKTARMFSSLPYIAISDDARFENEAAKLSELGAYIVEIEADPSVRELRGVPQKLNHASENGISSSWVHETLVNNGSKEALYQKIDILLEKLGFSGAYSQDQR